VAVAACVAAEAFAVTEPVAIRVVAASAAVVADTADRVAAAVAHRRVVIAVHQAAVVAAAMPAAMMVAVNSALADIVGVGVRTADGPTCGMHTQDSLALVQVAVQS